MKLGQIMLYVDSQDESMKFWTKILGFSVLAEEDNGNGMRWIEVGSSKDAGTSIVLHNKKFVAEMEPEMNLGTPSLMFFTEDIEQLRSDLLAKGITVGEIVNMPSGKVFNFADYEENYFAVMQKG